MLRLENVSKFYYQKGMISTGFTKVNLELNMGEFVVITGESGSGKSTLLNVLSGLDTYEEGEMYINGMETSHYDEKDFEEYRRRYVGNIFQNFNLVNSYTVYQNVELALLLNGENSKEAEKKILDIIEKVGLTEYKNTKCAKLSGGQKQRVAIARALAKETPIIVADEPTGNLDSEAANEVMKLLSEISKDKLVIIVTHNIEQVEKYATRLIKMHDGRIIEDKKVSSPTIEDKDYSRDYKDITVGNGMKLGVRNAFNIPVKFVLIFVVFLFVCFSLFSAYASFEKEQYDESVMGWNSYFTTTTDQRIVVNKPDKSEISEEELERLGKLDNVLSIDRDDLVLDYNTSVSSGDDGWYYMSGTFQAIDKFKGKVDVGRLPEKENEFLVVCSKEDYLLGSNPEDVMAVKYYFENYDSEGNLIKDADLSGGMKLVGISYDSDHWTYDYDIYAGKTIMEKVHQDAVVMTTDIVTEIGGLEFKTEYGASDFFVTPNKNVPKGSCYVSEELNSYVEDGNVIGETIKVRFQNTYIDKKLNLKVAKTYNKSNFSDLTGIKNYEGNKGRIYVNKDEYKELISSKTYQVSVFVDNVRKLDSTNSAIQKLGFRTLLMRDSIVVDGADVKRILSMMEAGVILALIVILFFISYFVIKLVLKSRKSYFTTIRTLGASGKVSNKLLEIELMVVAIIAYVIFVLTVVAIKKGLIGAEYLKVLASYVTPWHILLVLVIIVLMSLLLAHRFNRKMFKDSVMGNYREEV